MLQKRRQAHTVAAATAAPPLEESIAADSRLRRDGALALVLAIIIVAASMAYIATAIAGTRTLQTRNALERSESMARLCARLLDQQCDTALSVLQSVAEQPEIASEVRVQQSAPLHRYMKNAVDLVPDLLLAALFDAGGHLLQSYPADARIPDESVRGNWFREAARKQKAVIGDVTTVPDTESPGGAPVDVMIVVLPVGGAKSRSTVGRSTAGYLLAYYRLGDVYSYLRQVHLPGSAVLIVREDGHVAASSVGSTTSVRLSPRRALGLAASSLYGSRLESNLVLSDGSEPMLGRAEIVGYAAAARTGWTVFTIQPTAAAYAPSDSLLNRLLVLTLSLGGLVGITSWMLIRLYRRQQTLAAMLADRNDRLRRADRAKSDLLANVSHDLKTPIASIQLSVTGLLDDDDPDAEARGTGLDPAEVRECLVLVNQEMNELSGRVRNLLDMTLLESGGPAILRQPGDLTDIVAGTLERLRSLLRGRRVTADFPPDPLLVECDPAQLETAVMNLLENAHKYSPAGAAIHLSGRSERDKIVLRIRDEGPGIPSAEQVRVFDKFYRSGTRYASGGTGLGLAICRTIVEEHGGTIELAGGSGGAEFIIALPGRERRGDRVSTSSEGRLLLVEDDPTIQRLLKSQLTARGWAVQVVATGEAAISAIADGELDLVLLDIGLSTRGGMDGLEVCRQVRDWSAIPIILVTAADSAQTKIAALEMGADDYLTKPFHTGELVARIQAVLRRTRDSQKPPARAVIEIGPYQVNIPQREVRRSGVEIRLTKIEFDLLCELVRHNDRVLTYAHLLREVWGAGYDDVRSVHVHVSHLRRKLEPDITGPRYLLTIPGVGYRFRSGDS